MSYENDNGGTRTHAHTYARAHTHALARAHDNKLINKTVMLEG